MEAPGREPEPTPRVTVTGCCGNYTATAVLKQFGGEIVVRAQAPTSHDARAEVLRMVDRARKPPKEAAMRASEGCEGNARG
jgi:hypothetical protein